MSLTEFKRISFGYFAVNARGYTFSKTAINLAQEHNNKAVKLISGYIDQANRLLFTGISMMLRALLNIMVTKRNHVHSLVSPENIAR